MILTEEDYKVIELYKDMLPQKVFDAHAHVYHKDSLPSVYGSGTFCKDYVNSETYELDMQAFFPNCKFSINMIPMPDVRMRSEQNIVDKANDYLIGLLKNDYDNVGSVYVNVTDSEQRIADLVTNNGIRAIKCYHYSSPNPNPERREIVDFLPESAWVVANEKKLPIFLHVMKPNAILDKDNLKYVNTMTEKYPGAKLVLSHCARSFASHTVVSGIEKLSDNENVWFDTAAICESPSVIACLKKAKSRVVWGTDYPICLNVGKPISMGSGFCWITGDNLPPTCNPAHLVAESLLAHKMAFELAGLTQLEINAVFYDNAQKLFDKN